LVFIPNATHGVGIIAHTLTVSRRHRLSAGDEVLTTDHEYGACARAWRAACARTGALYRPVRLNTPVASPEQVVQAIRSALTERTRVLFLSHVTSPTGMVMPIAELCSLARDEGILTVIDGAHGPGQVPVDLTALEADFYTGNCHKWLCAPKGAAFLYARPGVQEIVEPLIVSWGTRPEAPGPSRFVDDLEFTGTRDMAAYLAVPAAIAFQADHGWDRVRARCHAMLRTARARLLSLPGAAEVHAADDRLYAQMEAVELPITKPYELHTRLFERHRIEVPCYTWNGRSILRVAVQGYNTEADIDVLMRALTHELG